MPEQELKLHVPAASRQAVQREIKQREATRIRLHAMYFDTPERELARARIAIRLRLEGRDWVQTLKMPGADAITRIEMNHPRPGPVLDLSVYAGTDVEAPLAAIKGELGLRYETDVLRLLRARTRHGMVELAYDTGILRAGTLELPISELEFELVSGKPRAIFAAARGWQQRHALVLDPRSKSERGDALAQLAHKLAEVDAAAGDDHQARRAEAIARFWAPRGAAAIKLREDMSPPQAMGAIAAECLDQIARNAAVLAEVDTEGVYRAGNSEHVHQLRVGVRRLRSAWKLFDGWIAPVPDAMLQQARAHFAAFGANRDQDVLNETVAPALARAGMPVIPVESTPEEDARTIAGGKAFQAWLLTCWNGAWTCRRQRPRRTATRSPTARPRTPRPSRPSAWKAACPARWCSPPSSRCKARAETPRLQSSWRGGCAAGTARSPIRACSSLRWTFPRATSCASAASGCATAWPSPNRCCPPPSCAATASCCRACRTSWVRSTTWPWPGTLRGVYGHAPAGLVRAGLDQRAAGRAGDGSAAGFRRPGAQQAVLEVRRARVRRHTASRMKNGRPSQDARGVQGAITIVINRPAAPRRTRPPRRAAGLPGFRPRRSSTPAPGARPGCPRPLRPACHPWRCRPAWSRPGRSG